MLHIIRQQYLHVELNGSESDGMALQHRLPALCRDWLLPALERTLDRHAPAEGTLCIERLEIDVGTMPLERLEHDLAEVVAQALDKALREQLPVDETTAAERSSGKAQRKTVQQSVNEVFVFFLKTGQLPWSFRLPEGRSLEQLVLAAWQETEQRSSNQGAEQVRQILASAAARKRLTRQFTPAFLQALLAMLAPESAAAMEPVFAVLRRSSLAAAKRQVEWLVWESTFAKAAAGGAVSTEELLSDVLPLLAAEHAAAAEMLLRHFTLADADSSSFLSQMEAETYPRHAKTPAHSGKETQAGKSSQIAASDAEGGLLSAQKPFVKPAHFIVQHKSPNVAAESIYISNAGLVLLHPFLPQFFTALGIAADKQLLQPERALCLLHFLATGQPVAPEYELMLPKLLCNIPLDEPVAADVDLTAAEQDEAVALLKAVVRHWEALRNTSPDGLRGTFLVRPGKISRRGDDWLLQVEPQTWDILLDQLPWGIGMIKLPWMDRLLHVEWR